VALYNLMEDVATAEISRAQVWQWIHTPTGVLADGRKVTRDLYLEMLPQEQQVIREEVGEAAFTAGKFDLAAQVFEELVCCDRFPEFLTLEAYPYLD
jgi:malate synthase